MRRLLACLWHYFASQRILPWLSGVGLVMIASALLVRGTAALSLLVMLGSVALVGFPILIGGLVFRLLASNPRMVMVPGLRIFAAIALFVLALIGAVLAGVVAMTAPREMDAPTVAALAFAVISLYLLLSQWLITFRWGFLWLIVLPSVLVRTGISDDPVLWQQAFAPWAWVAIACLAWLWLGIAVHRRPLARPLAANGSRSGTSLGAAAIQEPAERPRRIAPIATAPGTLMRGQGDNWPGRLVFALLAVLLMPVAMYAIFVVFGLAEHAADTRQFSAQRFLLLSFFGACFFPAMVFSEWPIRLRFLWLRVAGDRMGLWRLLERTLLVDILLIAAVTTIVGGVALLVSGLPREHVGLFIAGSILASTVATYLACWAGISGWRSGLTGVLTSGVIVAIPVLVPFLTILRLHVIGETLRAFWVLPALALLALIARELARSRFRRMDWCAVRPRRIPRRVV